MLEEKQKTASGSNTHGLWVCHKCGWTYPNPHPSAKHRRNHKKHCGKFGDSKTTGSPRERSSSPDSDEDLYVKPDIDAVKSNGKQDQAVEKSVVSEVHETSNRTEEEAFANAVTDALQNPKSELIQVGGSGRPDSKDGSRPGSLLHGDECVAFEMEHGDTSEGQIEQKPATRFNSVEVPRLQLDPTESSRAERDEEIVGLMGKPIHGHVQHIVGLRKDGLACILEQDSSKNEASNSIRGHVSASFLDENDESHVTQQQSDHPLDAKVGLLEVKLPSSDHSACLTKASPEIKVANNSNVQTGNLLDGPPKDTSAKICDNEKGYAESETEVDASDHSACLTKASPEIKVANNSNVQTGNLLDGPPKDTCAKICDNEKGYAESETEVDAYHEYQKGTNEGRSSMSYIYAKTVMPCGLERSAELDVSSKDNAVPAEAHGTKTYSEIEAPMMQISPIELQLPHSTTSGSHHLACLTLDSLEIRDVNSSTLSLSDPADVQTGNSLDCLPKGTRDKICNNEKGYVESEVEVDIYHEYYEGTNESGNSVGREKIEMPCFLDGSTELDVSLKDNDVLSETPDIKTSSDIAAQDVAPIMQISPGELPLGTTGSETVKAAGMDAFSLVAQVTDRSMLIESEIRKNVTRSRKSDGININYHRGCKDEESPVLMVRTNQPQVHSSSTASDIYEGPDLVKQVVSSVHIVTEESERTAQDNTNLGSDCHQNLDKVTPHTAPLTFIHPGTFLKGSYNDHEDPSLIKQEASLCPVSAEAPKDMADNCEVATAYLNGPHMTSRSPPEKMQDHTHEQGVKSVELIDSEPAKCMTILSDVDAHTDNPHACASSMDNVVSGHDQRILDQCNAYAEHREDPPMTTLSEVQCESDISELVCCDHNAISSGLSSSPSVALEDAASIVEPAPEVVVIDPCKTDYGISYSKENSLQQEKLPEKHISLSVVNGILRSAENSKVELAQAGSIEKEITHEDLKIRIPGDCKIRISDQTTDFNRQECSREHSPTMSDPFDASSTANAPHPVPSIYSDIGAEECDIPPAIADNRVTEIRDAVPCEDANASHSKEKTLLAYREEGDEVICLEGSTEKHVDVSTIVSACVKKELKEEQPPSDSQFQEKIIEELQSNQIHQVEYQIDITIPDTALHISDDEKSSSAYFAKSCGPVSVHPLQDSIVKDNRAELIQLDSSDSLTVREHELPPIIADAKVIEMEDKTIPRGDANASSSDENTLLAYKELVDHSTDVGGSPKKHVDIPCMVLSPVERELKEDQTPSNPQCKEKFHQKLGSNQNHRDESQSDIRSIDTELHIPDEEKSSLTYPAKFCGSCIVSLLEDSNVKDHTEKLDKLDSCGLKIKIVQSEDRFTASKSYVKTSTSGVNGTHASICQTDQMEGSIVSGPDRESCPTGDTAAPLDSFKADGENRVAQEVSGNVTLKFNSEPQQNEHGADIFEPPSFMTLIEPNRDQTGKISSPEMKTEEAVQNPTSSATEAAWFPSLSSVINDSQARKKNEEIITKAVHSRKSRTPLKSLMVENTEKGGANLEDHKATSKDDVKSESGTIQTKPNSDAKASKLASDKIYSSKITLDAIAANAPGTEISSGRMLGNKKEKRKNRGLHSWIYVCCSSIN